jgi:uncharacterized membrane protein
MRAGRFARCFTDIVMALRVLGPHGPVAVRLAVAVPFGVALGSVVGAAAGWRYAPAVAWIGMASVYLTWTWSIVGRLSADETRQHAVAEDPTRPVTDVVMLLASIASLGGVGYLLAASASQGEASDVAALLGVLSVAASWLAVHTVFTMRYTKLYYVGTPGGVNFHGAETEMPNYLDFAYLSFTIGMTYQVSDTDLQNRAMRSTALRQAILSYLLGAVVLAIIINLVAGLGHSGH